MNDTFILSCLEEAAEKLSIKVDYDDLKRGDVDTAGGIFVLRGERRILIHRGLHVREKVSILAELLADMNIDGIHLPPEVRKMLESAQRAHSL